MPRIYTHKTHCPKGHAYAGDNLATWNGWAQCRTCQRERTREWKAKHREEMLRYHLEYRRTHGYPTAPGNRRDTRPLEERLGTLIDTSGECWLWLGRLDRNGYGRYRADGEWLAHRLVYKTFLGPIPAGLTLDHLCRNRRCVRPSHLEPVTQSENAKRNPRKTHCPQGHSYSGSNLIVYKGVRMCRECRLAHKRAVRAADSAARSAA